jgi:hypothetical protein
MAWAWRLVSAGLLLLVGCTPQGQRVRHVLSLAPDGRVLRENADELELYDLDAERHAWRVKFSRPPGWRGASVEWSANGAYFVVGAEPYPAATSGHYTIWQRDTGRQVSKAFAIDGTFVSVSGGLAVSSDGRWFASDREGRLKIYDVGTGQVALEVPTGALRDFRLSFAPDSAHFSTANELFELRAGRWQPVAQFLGSRAHAWVGGRLALAMATTVAVWDGQLAEHITIRGPVRLVGSERLLAVIDAVEPEKAKYPSHLERLTLYDVELAATRFVRADLGSEVQVVFRGERIFVRAFHDSFDTFVFELDPSTGRTLRQQGFGKWAHGNRGRVSGRTFFPSLAPQAHYLEMEDSYDSHQHWFRKLELE